MAPVFLTRLAPVDRQYARQLGIPPAALHPVDPSRVVGVRVDSTWYEAAVGPWTVAYRLAAERGLPIVAELRIFPREPSRPQELIGEWSGGVLGLTATVPPGGITARLLRQVRVGEHYRAADRFLTAFRERIGEPPTHDGERRDLRWLGADMLKARGFTRQPRPGRPRLPLLVYATLARDYVKLITTGSRRPVAELATTHQLAPARIRDLLHMARVRGMLTPGQRGRLGGSLTPAARGVLAKGGGRARTTSGRLKRSTRSKGSKQRTRRG